MILKTTRLSSRLFEPQDFESLATGRRTELSVKSYERQGAGLEVSEDQGRAELKGVRRPEGMKPEETGGLIPHPLDRRYLSPTPSRPAQPFGRSATIGLGQAAFPFEPGQRGGALDRRCPPDCRGRIASHQRHELIAPCFRHQQR